MELEIPFEITACPRPRVTKYGTFYPVTYRAFREVVGAWLLNQNLQKIDGAIKVSGTFYIKTPKSWSKKKTLAAHCHYNLSRDIDNYQKSLFDVLNGILFEDDSQIASVSLEKRWHAEKGFMQLNFEKLEGGV